MGAGSEQVTYVNTKQMYGEVDAVVTKTAGGGGPDIIY